MVYDLQSSFQKNVKSKKPFSPSPRNFENYYATCNENKNNFGKNT